MQSLASWLVAHPDVGVVILYLATLGAHVGVGMLLHLVRLHDFDWHRAGSFVEQDWAAKRGLAILVTFLTDVAMQWGSQYSSLVDVYRGAAFVALAAACGASILPIARDTLYEAVQLVSGADIKPFPYRHPLKT